MRIRAKKGAILLGAIAGAAVATALIVYNVNDGNSVNVSDIEDSGLLSGLAENVEEALNGNTVPAVIADADSGDTAASAGVMGSILDEEAQKNEDSSVVSTSDPATEEAAFVNNAGESAQRDRQGGELPPEQSNTDVDSDLAGEEQYERSVSVDGQTSYEQSGEADPVYFYSETGAAATGEFTTTRRAREALAAKQADMERLEAAAKESSKNTSEGDWKVPDSDSYDDSFIVFN